MNDKSLRAVEKQPLLISMNKEDGEDYSYNSIWAFAKFETKPRLEAIYEVGLERR